VKRHGTPSHTSLTSSVVRLAQPSLVREKPIVMPVMLAGESRSTARKIHCREPSLPPGTLVWVEIDSRWMRARVERIEFACLHLTTGGVAPAARR